MSDQDDSETIRSFQWVDDDAPLPVNPDDPDAVAAALRWVTHEYRRYDGAYFGAVSEEGWEPGATELLRSDRDALGRFKAALMRTPHTMRQKDRAALVAWATGEPIRDGSISEIGAVG